MGVDPIHFGIIFIVNLEIGYLTPPVGLNLFVASTLFNRPLGHIIRSVGPFIALMIVGLLVITYVPAISIGLGDWIVGGEESTETTEPAPVPVGDEPLPGDEPTEAPSGAEPGTEGTDRMMSMEEMMRLLEQGGGDGGVPSAPEAPPSTQRAPAPPTPGRVMTMEEMMEAAEQRP
jgi:C4-dicarboxylate transporter DctM subunit